MDELQVKDIASKLHNARVHAQSIPQFGSSINEFNRSDAYSIQEEGIRLRELDGEKVIALKMGLTSEAKRKQMDLDAPLYGVLTDKMFIPNEDSYFLEGSIHSKIEPEIAFLITNEMSGVVTREEVLANCSGVCAALEILDSRYDQFKYFSMEEVISDNSSSSHYILGPILDLNKSEINLANLEMKMLINGDIAQAGNSKAISDDPVVSVMQLSQLLSARGKSIPANTWVLAGAATAAVPLEDGMKVELIVEGLQNVTVNIKSSGKSS